MLSLSSLESWLLLRPRDWRQRSVIVFVSLRGLSNATRARPGLGKLDA